MFIHATVFVFCSLLQENAQEFLPEPAPRGRTAVLQMDTQGFLLEPAPRERASIDIDIVPSQPPPQVAQNQVLFQSGLLDLAKDNYVIHSAPERGAMLMSLRTEQRDADGNVIRDFAGNPVLVPLRRGMMVSKGQHLGHFDTRELHAMLKINREQLEVAEAEMKKEIELIYAAYGVRIAENELQAMFEANRRSPGIHPKIEVDRAELALAQARANLELQEYTIEEIKTREKRVRESELERTQTQIGIREIVATIDGMIVEIHAAENEWRREGEPVLEIMNLDTLLVRVAVDTHRHTQSELYGKQAVAHVRLPNGRLETFPGRVVFCSPIILGDHRFFMFVEIQNPRVGNHWLLPRGLGGVDVVVQL